MLGGTLTSAASGGSNGEMMGSTSVLESALRKAMRGARRVARPGRRAHAHSGTHSYVYLRADDSEISGNVQFPIGDLNEILGLSIPQEEAGALDSLRTNRAAIEAYVREHLTVGNSWAIEFTGSRVLERKAGSYAILEYRIPQVPESDRLRFMVAYDGILHARAHHEALIIVKTSAGFGALRTETEQRLACTKDTTTHTVSVSPGSFQRNLTGAVAFLGAETKEYWRRARKRLRR